MATKVEGELYSKIDGQLHEIKRQLRQPNGYPFDPSLLQRALQEMIEGKFANEFNPVDFIGRGWKLAQDGEVLPENWDPTQVVLKSALLPEEDFINGEQTLQRFSNQPLLGVRAFMYYWRNKDKIPRSWGSARVLFDATIVLNPGNFRASLSLYKHEARWTWSPYWLINERNRAYASAVIGDPKTQMPLFNKSASAERISEFLVDLSPRKDK